ncbi:MAG TPA: ABC transporter permease [Steroidobacteraceae bacterium]|nr:ABC transporter permease [Steroidobacteraceae bacterium]
MNALTLDLLTPRRAAGAYLTEIRFELTRVLRNPALALPMMVVPVALYLLFAVLMFGDAISKDPSIGIFFFVGFGVLGVTMPGLFAISASLAMERELGLMRLKRAQPAPAGGWLVAKIVCGVLFSTLAFLPMLAAAVISGKLPLAAAQIAALSAALIVGTIPFCALGLMVGALVKGSAAPGYANLIYLPGCYLSGSFFPLPQSMHWQTPLWPQFHVAQLAMHAAGVEKFQFMPAGMAAATLLGFTVLFSAIALWRLARTG